MKKYEGKRQKMKNYDYLKKLYTDYWNRENHDRPLIHANVTVENPKPWIPAPKSLVDCWEDIEYIVASVRRGFENTYFGKDSVPVCNPNLGPDIIGAIAGCGLEYGHGTSWAVHNVTDWSAHPKIEFDENNRWWRKIAEITKAVAEDANGDYLVGITDLHPGSDGLVSLRSPENLCFDLIECPDEVLKRDLELFELYKEVYNRLDAIISPYQEGTINWMSIWHPHKRWYVTGSDFCCMIGKDDFEKFIIPSLMNELDFLEASIFHLDGPGALHHTDRLLEIPNLNGIQWVFGAGQPSGSHWLDLLKKIQGKGKLIQVACNPDEVKVICENLRPEGVQLHINGLKTKDEIDDIMMLAEKTTRSVWYGK
jgi:hypothetical protein